MCGALGRKLLAEPTNEDEATSPRRRPQPRTPDLLPTAESSSEITITLADCVWVTGEDGQAFPAGTIVRPPHGGHVVRGRTPHPVSGLLLELMHVDIPTS